MLLAWTPIQLVDTAMPPLFVYQWLHFPFSHASGCSRLAATSSFSRARVFFQESVRQGNISSLRSAVIVVAEEVDWPPAGRIRPTAVFNDTGLPLEENAGLAGERFERSIQQRRTVVEAYGHTSKEGTGGAAQAILLPLSIGMRVAIQADAALRAVLRLQSAHRASTRQCLSRN